MCRFMDCGSNTNDFRMNSILHRPNMAKKLFSVVGPVARYRLLIFSGLFILVYLVDFDGTDHLNFASYKLMIDLFSGFVMLAWMDFIGFVLLIIVPLYIPKQPLSKYKSELVYQTIMMSVIIIINVGYGEEPVKFVGQTTLTFFMLTFGTVAGILNWATHQNPIHTQKEK